MKKLVLFLVMLTISIVGFAQNSEKETTNPILDTEIVRKVTVLDIEGKCYGNVIVTFKSNKPDFVWTDKYKVKVTVTDSSGKELWNKTSKNSFLYVFSSGQIQVGKPNFYQIVIYKSSASENWIGQVREKEGIF